MSWERAEVRGVSWSEGSALERAGVRGVSWSELEQAGSELE